MNIISVTLLALALLPSIASAHGDWPAKHGGIMSGGGETSFELVQGKRGITVYVEDHGDAVNTQGARAMLTTLRANATTSLVATPNGANTLHVPSAAVRAGDKLTLKVTFANGSVAVGRFSVGN